MNGGASWHKALEASLSNRIKSPARVEISEIIETPLRIALQNHKDREATSLSILIHKDLASTQDQAIQSRVEACLMMWSPKYFRHCTNNQQVTMFECGDTGSPAVLSMDSTNPDLIIPDLFSMEAASSMRRSGQLVAMKREEFQSKWKRRSPILFWRGRSTGIMKDSTLQSFQALPRVQAAIRLRCNPYFSVKITGLVQLDPGIYKECLSFCTENQILSEPVPEEMFSFFRFYPDIPGNALAWGTIRKYINGNLVFKSVCDSRLCYHRKLVPWKHYIPVAGDFSDLEEKHRWAVSNEEESCRIAWNGHRKAISYLKKINKEFARSVTSFSNLQSNITGINQCRAAH